MIQEHQCQFLKGLQTLPAELINPPLKVIQHRPFIVIRPQPVQAFFEKVCLKDSPVHREKLIQYLALASRQVHPTAQQQPAFESAAQAVRRIFLATDASRFSLAPADGGELLALRPQVEQVLETLEARL